MRHIFVNLLLLGNPFPFQRWDVVAKVEGTQKKTKSSIMPLENPVINDAWGFCLGVHAVKKVCSLPDLPNI